MNSSAEFYEEMARRAKHFLRISSYDVAAGKYDIAMFHIEQAVQLALKAYLFRLFGDFPRTHSIKDLIDLSENECLRRLAEDKWYIVDILEDACIGGRYFIRRYGDREYSEAAKFAEGVFECTGISNI